MLKSNITSPDFASCRFGSIGILSAGIILNTSLVVLIILKKVTWFRGICFACSLCITDIIVAALLLSGHIQIAFVPLQLQAKAPIFLRITYLVFVYIQQAHLLAITYERYYACKYPYAFRSRFNQNKRCKILLVVWGIPCILIVLAFSMFAIVNSNFIPLVPYAFSIGYLFTLCTIFVMYVKIVQANRRAGATVDNPLSVVTRQRPCQRRQNRRLLRTSIGITGTYFILNGPVIVLGFLGSALAPCSSPFGIAMSVSITLTSLNVVCDPVIYFLLASKRGSRRVRMLEGSARTQSRQESRMPAVSITNSSRLQVGNASN